MEIVGRNRAGLGFTLIELIIALAVLVVMATIAVPNFKELIKSNRITSSTNNIVSALNFIKSEAAAKKNNVEGVVYTNKIVVLTGGGVEFNASSEAIGYLSSYDDGDLEFGPLGRPGQIGRVCIFYNGIQVREVSVTSAGVIAIDSDGFEGC